MKARYRCLPTALLVLALLQQGMSAADASPTEGAEKQLRETSQEILDLFRDAQLVAPQNTDKLVERLDQVLDERFDWETMARWVLGRHRRSFSAEQTRLFADLFSDYVVLYYLSQVEEHVVTGKPEQVDDVELEFRDARTRRDGAVGLEIVFITPKGTEVQTGYTLVHDEDSGEWQIRNFIVEGVSLVRNWRTQLARIRSPEEILELMRSKAEDLRDARKSRKQ